MSECGRVDDRGAPCGEVLDVGAKEWVAGLAGAADGRAAGVGNTADGDVDATGDGVGVRRRGDGDFEPRAGLGSECRRKAERERKRASGEYGLKTIEWWHG